MVMWATSACLAVLVLAPAHPAPDVPKPGPVERDVPYTDGTDQQKLDLYLPPDKGFPTVVFIYGGGWHRGSRKSVTPVGLKLQSAGYGCALLSHRLAPQDQFPAQIEDVAAGFAWVAKNIGSRGGDPKRVFLMGHSSGAHLALLLATDPRYLAHHGLTPAAVAGVVGLSTPVDLVPRSDGKGFGDAILGGKGADAFGRDVEVMKAASPIWHVSKDLPPTLLVTGDRDFPMLEKDAQAFARQAETSGRVVAVFLAKDCDHMAVVRSILDEKSPVWGRVSSFLAETGRRR
jgi:acetyl esterase/lipase